MIKKAKWLDFEHFITIDKTTKDNELQLYNTKYNAIFPHEPFSFDTNDFTNEVYDKYIRRFTRLKEKIINSQEDICFLYISQSSLTGGNFTIDGINIATDVYLYLSKIYLLIGNYRKNYRMVVFDSINNESKELLHKDIELYEIDPHPTPVTLIPQCDKYIYLEIEGIII